MSQRVTRTLSLALVVALAGPALAAGDDPTPIRRNDDHAFSLTETLGSGKIELLDALSSRYDLPYLGPGDILGDTNRYASESWGDVELFKTDRKSLADTAVYDTTYRFGWNYDDGHSTHWYPQGITGSGEGYSDGDVDGKQALAVSWYYREDPKETATGYKGARISFVDIDDLNDVRYRHVLLVEPTGTTSSPNFKEVRTHAGGIAWYGRYLYVADTSRGFRVFDLARMMRVRTDEFIAPGIVPIGIIGGEAYALGYKYVLPMVKRYVQPAGPDSSLLLSNPAEYLRLLQKQFTFSYLSIDRTTTPHQLIVGEYDESSSGRFAVWDLNSSNKLLDSGSSREVYDIRRTKTQGVARANAVWFYDHSYAEDQYRIHMQLPNGTVESIKGGYGLEDMHYDINHSRLWMLTEHPESRKVFFKAYPETAWE
jgi:hypothetical protein